MKFQFFDFPYDFSTSENLLLDVWSNSLKQLKIDPNNPKFHSFNINFWGCYPKKPLVRRVLQRGTAQFSKKAMVSWLHQNQGYRESYPAKGINIWVSHENRRPPHQFFDFTISSDLDSYQDTNVYFPHIFNYIDFFRNQASYVRHSVTDDELLSKRIISGSSKRKFACIFLNNPETLRLRTLSELRKIGQVDVFGRYSNRYVENKIVTGSEYIFQLCFENDFYPGYITEKPLEAWLSKSIPIYYGADSGGVLNSSSLLNLANYENLAQLLDEVNEIRKDESKQIEILQEPLLSGEYTTADIMETMVSRVNRLLENSLDNN